MGHRTLRNGCDHLGCEICGLWFVWNSWIHVIWWKKSRCFKMIFQGTVTITYPPDIEGGSWMKKLSSFPKWDINDRFVGVLSTKFGMTKTIPTHLAGGKPTARCMWLTTGGTWTLGHLQQALILGVPWRSKLVGFGVGKGGHLDLQKRQRMEQPTFLFPTKKWLDGNDNNQRSLRQEKGIVS